jgi:hypothetical protein
MTRRLHRVRVERPRPEPSQIPLELRSPGCTCEIPEMDHTGSQYLGAIGGDRVGHDLDCELMRASAGT